MGRLFTWLLAERGLLSCDSGVDGSWGGDGHGVEGRRGGRVLSFLREYLPLGGW